MTMPAQVFLPNFAPPDPSLPARACGLDFL